MEATRDVTIGNYKYQLTRFSARDGSWLTGQFLTKNLLAHLQSPDQEITEKDLGLGLAATFQGFSEDIFNRIQSKCLATIRRYEEAGNTTVAKPIVMTDGRWAVKDEPDPVELLALSVASLSFNLYCFFGPGALETLRTVFPDLSSLATPG
jgi:hypothetical protein